MATFDNKLEHLDHLTQIGTVDKLILQAATERPAKHPMMAPSTPDTYSLVGRDAFFGEIKDALLAGKPRAIAIELAMGIGKTALACQLANDDELGARFSDGILWANVGKAPDVRHELRRWAHELLHPDELGADEANADHGTEAYWQRVVKRALLQRRVLLVIDDVWDLESGRAFKVGGNDCAYLFTTRFPAIARELGGKVVTLPPLDVKQGIDLLEQFADKAVASDPEAARALVERVDGLPQALIPIGCFLRQASGTGQARRIHEALAKLDDVEMLFDLPQPAEYGASLPRSLRSVIEASYQWLGLGLGLEQGASPGATAQDESYGDQLRAAVASLAILRPNPAMFSEALAAQVAEATPETLTALCEAGLIEARDDKYTMHRTFAEYLRGKLAPERSRELHLRATAFYREQLRVIEEEYQQRESSYSQWYRYEDDAWGDTMDDWLYHLARAGEYRIVVTAFLRAWFDGFWWWGCFLDFKFCDQLLREWQQRDIRPQSRVGLRLLTRFKQAYPKETENRYGGDWNEVESVLGEVRAQAGLADLATLPPLPDARHLRGLTSIFLAEARRFGQRDYAGAEALYRDALQQFAANQDDWDSAWAHYHLADMLLEAGRPAEAKPLCEAALPLGVLEKDPEVQACLWRVLGDIALAEHAYDTAADAFHQAVLQAYRFQVEPEEPDPYTIRFYQKIAAQVVKSVVGLYGRAPADALALAARLRKAWDCCRPDAAMPELTKDLRAGEATALVGKIFPAALADGLLATEGERYANEVRTCLKALRDKNPTSGE